MPTYTYPAFIVVKAPTRKFADAAANRAAGQAPYGGNWEVYVTLDDGEPTVGRDDDNGD